MTESLGCTMPVPPLPIDLVEGAIRCFNGDRESIALDHIVVRCFADLDEGDDEGLIAERVVAIDKLWATQMFRRKGHTGKVIESILRHWATIMQATRSLSDDDLEHRPEEVTATAIRLLPLVMGYDEPPRAPAYLPYSFATKFLHWTTRWHFPIMDSRARNSIRTWHRDAGWPCPIPPESSGWPTDYDNWIALCSELIRSTAMADRERLVRVDFDTQPQGTRCEHTFLRVLDKAFYWGWSESGQPDGASGQ